jgi:dTDP-4-amino-4,6-dideoxygalactose transaminase
VEREPIFGSSQLDDEIAEKKYGAQMASQRLPYPAFTEPIPRAVRVSPSPVRRPRNTSELLNVLRPRLPSASELLPYLEEIDERRWYSNGGPLVTRLEEQLSRHYRFADRSVVTVANATVGLTAALLARRIPAGSVCLVPSWTFAATPHAARAAGLTPWFHDVDRRTWALHPDEVMETLQGMSRPVRAVIVVSPFGAPLNLEAWQEFEERTGIAVVVDGAAGFDTARPSRIPCVVSLHATKILGAGEGGFIATSDLKLLERARACCNFGFQGSRHAMLAALNAKMSEYHAAVALASLASWPETRSRHTRIMQWYSQGISQLDRVSLQPGYGNGWVSSTTSVLLPPRSKARITRHLSRSGIETREWWSEGCHGQPAFMDCPRSILPVTEELGARVLGLPHSADMQKQDVDRVLETLSEAISGRARERRRLA